MKYSIIFIFICEAVFSKMSFDGTWKLLHETFAPGKFYQYQSTYLSISADSWIQLDVLGRHSHPINFNYEVKDSFTLILRDQQGKSFMRFIRTEPNRLIVSFDKEFTSYQVYARSPIPEFEKGIHLVPQVPVSIQWMVDDEESVKYYPSEEISQLFETDFDVSFPKWSRLRHPFYHQPPIVYGLTWLTALVGKNEERVDSYRATLTLWVGIPNGMGLFIIPFAYSEEAVSLQTDQPIMIEGVHNEKRIRASIRFLEE